MNEIEITTRGWWRPSPGSIYPVLDQLSKEGLIKKREEDGKYELTEKGTSQVEEWPPFGPRRSRPQSIDEMLREISSYVSYFEELSETSDQTTRKKLKDQSARIKDLIERLSKLT